MPQVILDTDTFSELLADQNVSVAKYAMAYFAQFGNFTISALTFFEAQKGLVQKTEAESQ